MAELTRVESKLGEVIGLAVGAQVATHNAQGLDGLPGELDETLSRLYLDAKETERRAGEVASARGSRTASIRDEARDAGKRIDELLSKYVDKGLDPLTMFEALTMAEAGELVQWEILDAFAERAGDAAVRELCEWAIPIQRRHVEDVRAGALLLARGSG